MCPFGIKKACIGELGQRLAAPQAEGLAQRGRRRRQLAAGGQPSALRDQLLEPGNIDLAGSPGLARAASPHRPIRRNRCRLSATTVPPQPPNAGLRQYQAHR